MVSELFEKFKNSSAWNKLLAEQKEMFEPFFNGENIFLTGAAGTGKSFILKTLFQFCESEDVFISKTASTGIAALSIGGATLHSWLGIGLGDESPDVLIDKIKAKENVYERVTKCKILVIDEISMISGKLLNKVDYILRMVREKPDKPFGGIQMLITGDPFQLPPVSKEAISDEDLFFFNSIAWKAGKFKMIKLSKVVRQSNPDMAKALNLLRFGDDTMIDYFAPCINKKLSTEDGIEPIQIFSKRYDVDKHNHRRLAMIKKPAKKYVAYDWGASHHIQFFHKNCPATKEIELKEEAQVMLLYNVNVEGGLVNGSLGVVTGFGPAGEVYVEFKNGVSFGVTPVKWEIKEERFRDGKPYYEVVAFRKQIPLKLAYATTIHKSQGQSFDKMVVDLTDVEWVQGGAYTGLSRATNMDGLSIKNYNPKALNPKIFKPHPEVLKFYYNQ